MPNAILVSLAALYDDIAPGARSYKSAILRNTTCCWWRINPANAGEVKYAFGVVHGSVVSAYQIAAGISVSAWPILPAGAIGAGRRSIPVHELSEKSWNAALSWKQIEMFGPIRYCDVQIDSNGVLGRLMFRDRSPLDDELASPDD